MARKLTKKNPLHALRNKNRHSVLEVLRARGPVSVPEIARTAGFSRMTVHKLLEHLIAEGLAVDAGKCAASGDVGKRPHLFSFNAEYKFVFAVKITDRGLFAGITDLSGKIRASRSEAFRDEPPLRTVPALVRGAFDALAAELGLDAADCLGAVVGANGIIDAETGVCAFSPHFASWGRDIPLRELLCGALPDGIPVTVDNWLRFHAYAELKAREGRGVQNFIILGTERNGGLAGAVMHCCRTYSGMTGLAGEIGHMAVATDMDEACACGGRHCLETAVSPLRMERRVRAARRRHPDSLLGRTHSPAPPAFPDILAAAARGDAFARGFVEEAQGYFATALNCVLQLCDPGLVILQGEYAAAGEWFLDGLRERVLRLSLPGVRKRFAVEYSTLGGDGFLLGASVFLADALFRRIGEWAPDKTLDTAAEIL